MSGKQVREWCEMCGQQKLCYEVCIDDNMDTYMCSKCIKEARKEMDIEILRED